MINKLTCYSILALYVNEAFLTNTTKYAIYVTSCCKWQSSALPQKKNPDKSNARFIWTYKLDQ